MKASSTEGTLEVWSEFSLDQTLDASFTLPLFDKIGDKYVKSYGRSRGLKIWIEGGSLKFKGGSLLEATRLSGAWFNPHYEIQTVGRNARNILEKFLEFFPGLGISIDPWDKIAILYTVFLSRNTDYHNNTVRWMKKILKMASTEEKLSSVNLDYVGNSYQLRQLKEVKDEITSLYYLNDFEKMNMLGEFLDIRKKMLSIKYCGPKVVHGWGLFSLGLSNLSQVDRHLLYIGKYLGIISPKYKTPVKTLCMKSRCFLDRDCRILGECITYNLFRLFGYVAGWFQTAAYLYGAEYLCRGKDPLKLIKK
ncbi:MAG: hypothetical protein ABDH32_02385 [Candidatus Caldarchaeales archaeon]